MHQKRTWAIPWAHLMHLDALTHLQVRSRCAPKAHQMDLNKIVRTKSAPIWLSHIHSAPNTHLKNFTFFYNAPGAHQMDLNKLCAPKAQLFNLVIFTMHLICTKWTWNFAKSQVTFDFPITDTFWDMNQSKFKLWLIHIEKDIKSNLTFFLRLYSSHPYKRSDR